MAPLIKVLQSPIPLHAICSVHWHCWAVRRCSEAGCWQWQGCAHLIAHCTAFIPIVGLSEALLGLSRSKAHLLPAAFCPDLIAVCFIRIGTR